MATKATDKITVYDHTDTIKVIPWYYKQLRTNTNTPTITPGDMSPSGWTTTEPTISSVSDLNYKVYTASQNVYGNNTCWWGDVSLLSSYEAAIQAYNKGVSAEGIASAAAEDAYDVANATFGQTTYRYASGSTTYVVYRTYDDRFYYLNSNGDPVYVTESQLVTSGGEIVTYTEDGLMQSINSSINDLGDSVEANAGAISTLDGKVDANAAEARNNSLISREYAEIVDGHLFIYGNNENHQTISALELSSTEVKLSAQGVAVASMANESGEGVMQADVTRQSNIRFRTPDGTKGIFDFIAQSDGHLSCKIVGTYTG